LLQTRPAPVPSCAGAARCASPRRGVRRRLGLRSTRHVGGGLAHLLAQPRRVGAARRNTSCGARIADIRATDSLARRMVVMTVADWDLATPAALIDAVAMKRNIARLQERMIAHGVRLRPHVKTPKCIEVARLQLAAGARGVTASTLKEAEQFFDAGVADILYAVCIPPSKLERVLAMRRRGCALTILIDSVAAAQGVTDKGHADNHAFDVMIEIDTDGHRSGVKPDDPLLIEIGTLLHRGGATLKGVMTHAGSSYDFDTPEALQRVAEQERAGCVH